MNGPLRIVVVGLGARARTWLDVIDANDEVVVAGLADPRDDARATMAARYRGVPVAGDLASLAGRVEADAVLLVTPPGGREAQIEAALGAGLHIVAEKPLADSVAQAESYVEAAEAAGRHLIVGLNFRYLPVTRALRDLLRSGRIGRPEFARFTYERWRDGTLPRLNKYPLTMEQPMLWEQSIHHFDLMRFVYGQEPVRVHARTFNPSWSMYRGDANVSALIDFDGGMFVNYQGTWQGGVDRLDFEWRTDCANGVALQRDMFGDLVATTRGERDYVPVPLDPLTPWITDATAVLCMIVEALKGRGVPECTGRDHLQSLRMVEACIRSSRSGRPVTLA
ncbi:MAG: Gfo/Idh/MocA family protein [Roseicyclus sp.]